MQFAPGRADPLGQAALDRKMDVFVGKLETEAAGIDLALDRAQSGDDFGGLGAPHQAGSRKHPRMRDRSPDVMAVQPPIERQRGGEGFDLGQTRARKAAANQALGSIGASTRRFGGGVCERCLKGDAWAARFHRELEGSSKIFE